MAIWDLNGQTVTAAPVIGNPGASWKAIGRGDFNGDWYPDILFQNTDGTVAIWEMKGDTAVGNPVIGNPGTSWHPIVGTGFFWYPYRSDATAASASAPSTATPSGGQPSDGAFGFNDVSDPVPAGSATAPSGGMPLPQSSSGSDPLLLTPGSTPLVDLTVPHGTVFG